MRNIEAMTGMRYHPDGLGSTNPEHKNVSQLVREFLPGFDEPVRSIEATWQDLSVIQFAPEGTTKIALSPYVIYAQWLDDKFSEEGKRITKRRLHLLVENSNPSGISMGEVNELARLQAYLVQGSKDGPSESLLATTPSIWVINVPPPNNVNGLHQVNPAHISTINAARTIYEISCDGATQYVTPEGKTSSRTNTVLKIATKVVGGFVERANPWYLRVESTDKALSHAVELSQQPLSYFSAMKENNSKAKK
jgi:hypothetical protein